MLGIERKTARREKHLNGKLNLNLLFQQHPASMMKVSFSVNIYFRLLHKFIYAPRSFSLTREEKRFEATKYSLSQHEDTRHASRNDFIMFHTPRQTDEISIKIAWKIESLR